MEKRAVIHVDLDAFFASVEMKKRPGLAGRPVIVGASGDPSKRGVVSAASYEARKYGVRSGMPMKTAKRLCPEAVFLPVDFESYERESERFMGILRRWSPLVESFGLDEAFVELLPAPAVDPMEASIKAAYEIKEAVRRELGLSASVGVAPNKLLSKLASDMKKPGGVFIIRPGEAVDVLRDLQVRKLPGVGPKTEARLLRLGIRTIGELATVPKEFLERNFGPGTGRTLHDHSRGIDSSPVVPFHEPESMGREVTFEEDTSDMYIIKETLYALTDDVVARLKSSGYLASTVTIKVRYSDFRTITRSTTLPSPVDSMNDVWGAALRLTESVDYPLPVRLVGVKVSKLKERK